MDKKKYFIRRITFASIQTFTSAFVALSWSKQIFDNMFAGLMLFQIYLTVSGLVNLGWNFLMTRNRTRKLRFQQILLPHYNIVKYLMIFLYTIEVVILLTTGLKYIFVVLFGYLLLSPITHTINGLESRVEKIIMEADTLEDIDFLASKTGTFTTTANLLGMGLSTLLLAVFHISMLPLWLCIIGNNVISILDNVEMSRYINITRNNLIEYYITKISELKCKDVYNNTIEQEEVAMSKM